MGASVPTGVMAEPPNQPAGTATPRHALEDAGRCTEAGEQTTWCTCWKKVRGRFVTSQEATFKTNQTPSTGLGQGNGQASSPRAPQAQAPSTEGGRVGSRRATLGTQKTGATQTHRPPSQPRKLRVQPQRTGRPHHSLAVPALGTCSWKHPAPPATNGQRPSRTTVQKLYTQGPQETAGARAQTATGPGQPGLPGTQGMASVPACSKELRAHVRSAPPPPEGPGDTAGRWPAHPPEGTLVADRCPPACRAQPPGSARAGQARPDCTHVNVPGASDLICTHRLPLNRGAPHRLAARVQNKQKLKTLQSISPAPWPGVDVAQRLLLPSRGCLVANVPGSDWGSEHGAGTNSPSAPCALTTDPLANFQGQSPPQPNPSRFRQPAPIWPLTPVHGLLPAPPVPTQGPPQALGSGPSLQACRQLPSLAVTSHVSLKCPRLGDSLQAMIFASSTFAICLSHPRTHQRPKLSSRNSRAARDRDILRVLAPAC